MKFQRVKDIICGALVASLVLCTAPMAFAKVANMNIPVSYNNIKVIVDGKQLQTSKEPFTYEGTTYLPIRAVAEAVGKDVTWDGATKTVYLGVVPTSTTNEKVPKEYESALKQAKSYSDNLHMSKQAIYDQLISEYGGQFSKDAAQYAIDNVDANWKQNALESANSYQNTLHMSPAAIYDQLVSEYGGQFTAEEAQYAVDNMEK